MRRLTPREVSPFMARVACCVLSQLFSCSPIEDYLAEAGHRCDLDGAPFRPAKNNRTDTRERHLDPAFVYCNIVPFGAETGISAQDNGLSVHSLRATAATNALAHESDIARVQEWLGHANVPWLVAKLWLPMPLV
jgi:hypothetical protein